MAPLPADATLHLDGADLRLSRAGAELLRIDVKPFSATEIYCLFPEIMDGAHCAVTVYGEPALFTGRIRDEIGNKFQTELLDQRERLEFVLTEEETDAEGFRRALAHGPSHELFGSYFHVLCCKDKHTTIFCREDSGVAEKIVPYFLRRPWFQSPEKHVRTDAFILPKFLAAAREGIHVAAGRVTFLEESEPAVAGVGPFLAQTVMTPARRRAAGAEAETLRYGCDAAGNLKFIAREQAPLDAWLEKDADAWVPGRFPTSFLLGAVGAAGAAGSVAAAGAARQGASAVALLSACAGLAVWNFRRTARNRLAAVALHEPRLAADGGITRLDALVSSENDVCLDLFQADLVLLDGAGAEVARRPLSFPFLPPRTRYPVTVEFPDPSGAGASARLEPLADA